MKKTSFIRQLLAGTMCVTMAFSSVLAHWVPRNTLEAYAEEGPVIKEDSENPLSKITDLYGPKTSLTDHLGVTEKNLALGRYQFNYTGNTLLNVRPAYPRVWNSSEGNYYNWWKTTDDKWNEDWAYPDTLVGMYHYYNSGTYGTITDSLGGSTIKAAYLMVESSADGKFINHDTSGEWKATETDNGMKKVTFITPDKIEHNLTLDYVFYNTEKSEFRATGLVDVTEYMQGYGEYGVKDVPWIPECQPEEVDIFCGWQLIIVEENEKIPTRALTLEFGNSGAHSGGNILTTLNLPVAATVNPTGQLLYGFAGGDPSGSGNSEEKVIVKTSADGVTYNPVKTASSGTADGIIRTTSCIRTDKNSFVNVMSRNGIPISGQRNPVGSYTQTNSWYVGVSGRSGDYWTTLKTPTNSNYTTVARSTPGLDAELIDFPSANAAEHYISIQRDTQSITLGTNTGMKAGIICSFMGMCIDINVADISATMEINTDLQVNQSPDYASEATFTGKATIDGEISLCKPAFAQYDTIGTKNDKLTFSLDEHIRIADDTAIYVEIWGDEMDDSDDAIIFLFNGSSIGNWFDNYYQYELSESQIAQLNTEHKLTIDIGNVLEYSYDSCLACDANITYLFQDCTLMDISGPTTLKCGLELKGNHLSGSVEFDEVLLVAKADDDVENCYNLHIDYNGGQSSGKSEYYYGLKNNGAETVAVPTREGYTFAGWQAEDMDEKYAQYKDESGNWVPLTADILKETNKSIAVRNLTKSNEIVTLKAQWTPIKYNISYELNGGIAGANMPVEATFGETVTISNPAKENYYFSGWTITGYTPSTSGHEASTWEGETGTTFKNLRDTAGTVTFTAKWTTKDFTLKYDANGGSNAPAASIVSTETVGISPIIPVKTGYKFLGWSKTSDWNTERYVYDITAAYGGITAKDKTIATTTPEKTAEGWRDFFGGAMSGTLYAMWEVSDYKITFDYNKPATSEEMTGNTVTSKTVTYNTQIGNLPAPALNGYTFNGWYTSRTGGTQFTSSTVYNKTKNITLYAVWKPINNKITLDPDIPDTDPNYPETLPTADVIFDEQIPDVPVPTRKYTVTFNYNGNGQANTSAAANYKFKGYFSEKNGTGTQYYDENGKGLAVWKETLDKTLYAKWEPSSVVLPVPERTGYTFTGWYTSATGGEKITDKKTYTPTKDITVYAHWILRASNVTFESNRPDLTNGYTDNNKASSIPVLTGNKVVTFTYDTSIPVIPTVSLKGWTFEGWYDSKDKDTGTKVITSDGKANTETSYWNNDGKWQKTGDITLYAHWVPNTYKILLSGNTADGTVKNNAFIQNGVMDSINAVYDVEVTLPANIYVKQGYDFLGWNTSPYGIATWCNDGAKAVNLADTNGAIVTLYAQWQEVEGGIIDKDISVDSHDITYKDYSSIVLNGNGALTADGKTTMTISDLKAFTSYAMPECIFGEKAWKDEHIDKDDNSIQIIPEGKYYYVDEQNNAHIFMGWSVLPTAEYTKDYDDGTGRSGIIHTAGEYIDFLELLYEYDAYTQIGSAGTLQETAKAIRLKAEEIKQLRRVAKDKREITLYAVWDDFPVIDATDMAYLDTRLKALTNDELVAEFIAHITEVTDKESGRWTPDEPNPELTVDVLYKETTLETMLGAVGCWAVTNMYVATDSVGNTTYKYVYVWLCEAEGKPPTTYVRAINRYFYETHDPERGGLRKDSVWYNDPHYVQVINEMFDNADNDTPEMIFTYEHKHVLATQAFISGAKTFEAEHKPEEVEVVKELLGEHYLPDGYGLGNSRVKNALTIYYNLLVEWGVEKYNKYKET